ncbi:MAG: ATP-binding protein [Oscillospiraceae bacterium]|nr:ATP-binding protein [Oscillospiraceae bacterium]
METTEQYQTKNSSFPLRLKIIAGYVSLLVVLGIIISMVWLEHRKLEALNKNETLIHQKRESLNQTIEKLLDFSFSDDFLLLRDNEKFDEYRMKREVATNALNKLKQYYPSDVQHSQIDKISSLLEEKENLLFGVMNTLSDFSYSDSLLQRRIPVIASQAQIPQQQNTTEVTEKKRSGLFGLFKKKEEKSAYARQREKQNQPSASRRITGKLYSLQKEMHAQYTDYWNRLEAYSDSLQRRNMELNSQISGLICEFEQAAVMQSKKESMETAALREQSFRIILFIEVAAILLIVVFYLFIHHDLRKRLEYRMRLEASDRKNKSLLRSRKDMMMGIAHDLRSPLAVIKGAADLLPGEADKVRQDEFIESIRHSSDYMLRLVNTLIEFYQLDTDRPRPDNSLFPLETLFKEIAGNYAAEAQKKNLRFVTSFSGLDLIVSGDRMRIRQIAGNLLSNAIKFTNRGEISFQGEYANGELRFGVQDTGMGMTKEEKTRIFNAFERLDNARNISGFGLGLATSSLLVSQMDGTITVESVPGKGSTFMVFLPLPEADGSFRIEETPAADYRLDGVKVLVMDDDRIQLNITREMFRRNRITCDCCETSRELFSKLKEHTYDLVLTDIQMPETDGYGILELLRGSNIEAARTVPVVAVTARADDESTYTSCGFAGCIHKPFTMEGLMDAVMRITGQKEEQEWKPDFSLILSGEDNREEMLALFIRESQKDLQALSHALEKQDKEAASSILHKNLPLWETVRLDYPLSRLRELATGAANMWTDEQYVEMREIINAVEKLVSYAKKIREADL